MIAGFSIVNSKRQLNMADNFSRCTLTDRAQHKNGTLISYRYRHCSLKGAKFEKNARFFQFLHIAIMINKQISLVETAQVFLCQMKVFYLRPRNS